MSINCNQMERHVCLFESKLIHSAFSVTHSSCLLIQTNGYLQYVVTLYYSMTNNTMSYNMVSYVKDYNIMKYGMTQYYYMLKTTKNMTISYYMQKTISYEKQCQEDQ